MARTPQGTRAAVAKTTGLVVASWLVCGAVSLVSLFITLVCMAIVTPIRHGGFISLGGGFSLSAHLLGLSLSAVLTVATSMLFYLRGRRVLAQVTFEGTKRLASLHFVTLASIVVVLFANGAVFVDTISSYSPPRREHRASATLQRTLPPSGPSGNESLVREPRALEEAKARARARAAAERAENR